MARCAIVCTYTLRHKNSPSDIGGALGSARAAAVALFQLLLALLRHPITNWAHRRLSAIISPLAPTTRAELWKCARIKINLRRFDTTWETNGCFFPERRLMRTRKSCIDSHFVWPVLVLFSLGWAGNRRRLRYESGRGVWNGTLKWQGKFISARKIADDKNFQHAYILCSTKLNFILGLDFFP